MTIVKWSNPHNPAPTFPNLKFRKEIENNEFYIKIFERQLGKKSEEKSLKNRKSNL
jgi:hypothetical protein